MYIIAIIIMAITVTIINIYLLGVARKPFLLLTNKLFAFVFKFIKFVFILIV